MHALVGREKEEEMENEDEVLLWPLTKAGGWYCNYRISISVYSSITTV